jgi:hypothetical protein
MSEKERSCYYCEMLGHYKKKCRKKKYDNVNRKKRYQQGHYADKIRQVYYCPTNDQK